MKLHTPVAALALALALCVPALAQHGGKKPAPTKAATVVKYKAHCGMIYSAAEAKKNHYICPMDHKPLTKIVVKR